MGPLSSDATLPYQAYRRSSLVLTCVGGHSTLAGTMNTHNDSSDAAFIAKKLLAGDEISL